MTKQTYNPKQLGQECSYKAPYSFSYYFKLPSEVSNE